MIFDYCFELLQERVLRPLERSLCPVTIRAVPVVPVISWLLRKAGHMEVWLLTVHGFASGSSERNVSVGPVPMIQLEITGN